MKPFREFRNTYEDKMYSKRLDELENYYLVDIAQRSVLIPNDIKMTYKEITGAVVNQLDNELRKRGSVKHMDADKIYYFNEKKKRIYPYPYDLYIGNDEINRIREEYASN